MKLKEENGFGKAGRTIRSGAFLFVLAMLVLGASGCSDNDNNNSPSSADNGATLQITPGWTVPAPPNATVNQSYTASVTAQDNSSYLWSVASGSATLIDETTRTVTFTPTAAGSIRLQCVITAADNSSTTLTYDVDAAAGAVLNANPATITGGQGTILLATFTGTTGVINPGNISVTSGVGIPVTPATTTTYSLTVDGNQAATMTVNVLTFMPKFVYVAGGGGNISAFTLNTDTGGLTEIAGSPYTAISYKVLSDPSGKFLFSTNISQGVSVYSVDNVTGALTSVAGSPFVTDNTASTYNIAVDPMGRFVYATHQSGNVYGFRMDPVTGVLTAVPGSPFHTGTVNIGDILVHPSGKYLYVAVDLEDTVDAFSIDQATGALTRVDGAPFAAGVDRPLGVAVDPTGAYLFAKGETEPSMMAGFSIDIGTGALTAVAGSPFGPFTGSDSWHGLCFHPTKSILYNSFYGSNEADVGASTLDLATGALTPMTGSPYSLFVNHGSDAITVDRSGRFAFAVNYSGGLVARMRIDANGLLTKLDGTPLGVQDVDTTPVTNHPVSVVVAGSLTASVSD